MKIGITGATGQLGRLVVEKLKKRVDTENLAALVRSPEKAADLGIEVREFDLTNPETFDKAMQDIDHLLFISVSEFGEQKIQREKIFKAAQKAGIKWIVYTSLLHADTSTINLASQHLETENLLKASGIPYTILRNGWYTENYTASIPGALGAGALVGSAGEGKISSATREDFAEAATVVLTEQGHEGKVYELAGDDAYTLKDFAAEISRHSGKDIPYNNLPEKDYAGVLKSAGFPGIVAEAFASWDIAAAKGDLYNDSKQLSKLIGRPTTPMTDTVKKALES